MDTPLVHLCAPATWRMALAAGSLAPPSLLSEGFVHLSTPGQVRLPANTLFTGRNDLLALVIDPARLPGELRFEAPRDGTFTGQRFPHHYGMVPVHAVTSVIPYPPASDGRFADPVGLPAPGDLAVRARQFERGLARRRAAALVPVEGGVAVLEPRFPASYEHNTLWIDGPTDAGTVMAEAQRALGGAGVAHRRAVLDDPAVASALADRGWHVRELRLMIYGPDIYGGVPAPASRPEGSPDVVPVPVEVLSQLWERSWRRDFPRLEDGALRQLIAREPVTETVLRVVNLAVLDHHGEPVASAQLYIDGATAAIETLMADPAHRRAGLARALVSDALRRAQQAECDVVLLTAEAGGWPYQWYRRLGFTDQGARFEASIDHAGS